MSHDPQRPPQQLPPPSAWTSAQPPPHPQYPVHPSQLPYQYPPPPPHPGHHPDMAAIQPHMQHPQDPYRLPPPPHGPYQRPPEVYPPAPPVVYQAAAPRQRTAIACRYCRRRKIRCSGFDTSQDGRCSNCVRFNQECMFTPVSSQTQAFVPAHAAYPHLRNQAAGRGAPRLGEAVQLYGPHGHPLPPQHHLENTLPPPTGLYQQPYGRPVDDRGHPAHMGHPPPPMHDVHPQDRRESAPRYDYSHQGHTLPPVSAPVSVAPYPPQPTPSPSAPQYYSSSPDRRPTYAYDTAATTSAPPPASSYQTLQPSQPQPVPVPVPVAAAAAAADVAPTATATSKGPTPPPAAGGSRSGLSVRDMLGPPADGPNTRSSTDSDMLNALNRSGLKQ